MPNQQQGPVLCTTATNVANGQAHAWTNINNIKLDTGVTASSQVLRIAGQGTQFLEGTGFGLSVPASSSILGAQFSVKRKALEQETNEHTGEVQLAAQDLSVRLLKAGIATGTDAATTSLWATTLEQVTYGGATDLWGATLTPADVNNAGYGLGISAQQVGTRQQQISVNLAAFYATVFYQVPSPVGPSNGGVTAFQQVLLFPMANGLYAFDPTQGFNDPLDGQTYTWRSEELVPGRTPTVSRLIVSYIDLGLVTVTFQLTGSNDDQEVVTATKQVVLGNTVPTGALLTRIVDITLTASNLQLRFTRAAGAGSLAISKVLLAGRMELQSYG